jgi:hypothetical protein
MKKKDEKVLRIYKNRLITALILSIVKLVSGRRAQQLMITAVN